ncbi:MAG: endo-1,4-beta-xylanase [Patescibacteria group bacterium]
MKKILYIFLLFIFLIIAFYLFLQASSLRRYKVNYGLSFNQIYTNYLGLDWRNVYQDMILNLQPKYIRIAAMWSEVEKEKGFYDFADVDWMMKIAAENNVKVTLVVGQKAPRWPECHVPDWTNNLTTEEYKKELFEYIKTTVERYKDNSALELWQVENEAFIKFKFGNCLNYKSEFVAEEVALTKKLDEKHWIMMTDSGELSTWMTASKYGDIFGSTLYRIVRSPSGRIWTYDLLPPAFYRIKAMLLKIPLERFYIAELQAEPWFNNADPLTEDLATQSETMNLERLKKHFDYAERIGVNRVYVWGVEWWYWLKEKQNNPNYLEYIKNKIK